MDELLKRIKKFRNDRDWEQFHTPENLAKSIVIEAAELLENFQWNGEYDKENVMDELADVMNYCFLLADTLDIDMISNMHRKIDQNEIKYPAELVKGSSKKYTEYKIKAATEKAIKDSESLEKEDDEESKETEGTEASKKEDRGSAEMFDLDENPWGDENYLDDNPYPHFG